MHNNMKILLIDNYDSYTYNIYQILSRILEFPPIVIRNDTFATCSELINNLAKYVDAIVISPGPGRPDNPKDFGICSQLFTDLPTIPILGICLGHQGLALAYGAEIVNAPQLIHGQISHVEHDGSDLFTSTTSPFMAVRYHSFIVHEDSLPECLIPIAWTTDTSSTTTRKRRIIMGLEHRVLPQFGVQFHPESIGSEFGVQLFKNFCQIVLDRNLVNPSTHPRSVDLSPYPGSWLHLSSQFSTVPSANNRHSQIIKTEDDSRVPLAVHLQCLDNWHDPELVFGTVFNHKTTKCPIWLDSACIRGSSRWSYIGALSPSGFHLSYTINSKAVIRSDYDGSRSSHVLESTTFIDYLDELMTKDYYVNRKDPECIIHHQSLDSSDLCGTIPPFLGGFAGYMGYEMKCETLNLPVPDTQSSLPDVQLVFADRVFAFDHIDHRVWLVAVSSHDQSSVQPWFDSISTTVAKLSSIDPRTQHPLPKVIPVSQFTPDLDKLSYLTAIETAQGFIEHGESYEICMTTQFRRQCIQLDSFKLYKTLRRTNPAPFASYFRMSERDWIACTSPELFMNVCDGHITMKPIKGTARRGVTCAEDLELRAKLHSSVKDRAENMMIVDLIRNDLNLIARPDSVRVPKLMAIETYETVHQMVSTIKAVIHPQLSSVQVFKHIFPPGSMTGAPKVRTVQLLESSLEVCARGVYSGCIGYISVCGNTCFNVVIRTVVGNSEEMTVGAGGAIIALSDPGEEWDEVLTKSSAVVGGVEAYMAFNHGQSK